MLPDFYFLLDIPAPPYDKQRCENTSGWLPVNWGFRSRKRGRHGATPGRLARPKESKREAASRRFSKRQRLSTPRSLPRFFSAVLQRRSHSDCIAVPRGTPRGPGEKCKGKSEKRPASALGLLALFAFHFSPFTCHLSPSASPVARRMLSAPRASPPLPRGCPSRSAPRRRCDTWGPMVRRLPVWGPSR